jgi:hypothetical protein
LNIRPGTATSSAPKAQSSVRSSVSLGILSARREWNPAVQAGIQGEQLRLLREQASRPVTEQLHAYLLKIKDQLLPKSEAGQAVSYLLKNWLALTRYLEDGTLEIDNNRTERSLRGVAMGSSLCTSFLSI